MDHRTCRECSQPLPSGSRPDRIYCSKRCANRKYVIKWRKMNRDRRAEYFDRTCVTCSTEFRSSRPTGKFCSDKCKGVHYSKTKKTRSKLPVDHPVIVLIAEARRNEIAARKKIKETRPFIWQTARECPGCACRFTPLYSPNAITCSKRCARRVSRWRRNAAERNAVGTFTWSEFMAIARRFGYCCAYCGVRPGQLDPDHVVPLSRGGINSTTNLLPSCRQCNGDKRDLLLSEWSVDREARGKEPRATEWDPGDRRYWHLTQAHLDLRVA